MVSGSTLAIGTGRGYGRRGQPAAAAESMLAAVSLNLSPGEQVIFQGHPSWRAILGFYLKGILVAIVLGVIAKLVGAQRTSSWSSSS